MLRGAGGGAVEFVNTSLSSSRDVIFRAVPMCEPPTYPEPDPSICYDIRTSQPVSSFFFVFLCFLLSLHFYCITVIMMIISTLK